MSILKAKALNYKYMLIFGFAFLLIVITFIVIQVMGPASEPLPVKNNVNNLKEPNLSLKNGSIVNEIRENDSINVYESTDESSSDDFSNIGNNEANKNADLDQIESEIITSKKNETKKNIADEKGKISLSENENSLIGHQNTSENSEVIHQNTPIEDKNIIQGKTKTIIRIDNNTGHVIIEPAEMRKKNSLNLTNDKTQNSDSIVNTENTNPNDNFSDSLEDSSDCYDFEILTKMIQDDKKVVNNTHKNTEKENIPSNITNEDNNNTNIRKLSFDENIKVFENQNSNDITNFLKTEQPNNNNLNISEKIENSQNKIILNKIFEIYFGNYSVSLSTESEESHTLNQKAKNLNLSNTKKLPVNSKSNLNFYEIKKYMKILGSFLIIHLGTIFIFYLFFSVVQ